MSCGVGCRHNLDLALLWLWRRPKAVALIRRLAWEPPYAAGAALKSKQTKKKLNNLGQIEKMQYQTDFAGSTNNFGQMNELKSLD